MAWPCDHPFHLIVNIALAGARERAGGPIDDDIFPPQMLVDFVRVYQRCADELLGPGPGDGRTGFEKILGISNKLPIHMQKVRDKTGRLRFVIAKDPAAAAFR